MATRKPRFDEVIDGVRVRVFAARTEYEVVFGDTDVSDPEAEVFCYPKVGTADVWARQARLEFGAKAQPAS